MFNNDISLRSSRAMNEFNREEEQIVIPPLQPLQKLTSFFIFLCPLLFLSLIFIISIPIIAIASTIDDNLLEKTTLFFSQAGNDSACETAYSNISEIANFVLFNFIAFKVLSSLNLLLSIIGLIVSIGYIFFYYKLKIQKRFVFGSDAIPPFLSILNGFVIFFCILQSSIYWANVDSIDSEVLNIVDIDPSCYNDVVTAENISQINENVASEVNSLNGLAVFLFVWSLIFLILWAVCYSIRRFKLKEAIYSRPI